MISMDSLLKAAESYFKAPKGENNERLQKMFQEQPAFLELFGFLEEELDDLPTRVIILQLIMIFYHAISLQKIKVAKISYSDFLAAIAENIKMRDYYDDPDKDFDEETFKRLFENYPQKEILQYTNTALHVHYQNYITNEQEASRIFYAMKIFGEVVDQNIIE